ncbi:MAG: dethiobiotin synthase [Acidobacteria bacterium]|nr:dethiobiotin synthase [Acidobacteriota bacterium]
MRRGLFVTGTDTGVGKTIVCSALMQRYRDERPLGYWKPVQTGIEQDDDTAVVRDLGDCAEVEIFDEGVRLRNPVSPHLAARLSGTTIALADLESLAGRLATDRTWIVEGAGGVLVPLNDRELMTDWMARLGLPALVVARTAVGTINHTLLTLEALKQRSLKVAGVVMVGERNEENRHAIEHYGRTRVIAEMPLFRELTAAVVGDWARDELDRAGHLWR